MAPDKRCLVCPECGATASYSEAKKKEKKDAKEPEAKSVAKSVEAKT